MSAIPLRGQFWLLRALPRGDEAVSIRTRARPHDAGKTRQRTLVGFGSILGDPAFQVESQRALSRDPFPIVLAGDVNVRACAIPGLTGRVPDRITRSEALP